MISWLQGLQRLQEMNAMPATTPCVPHQEQEPHPEPIDTPTEHPPVNAPVGPVDAPNM